jgi:phage/plasmid primase-like uncharacterized protein
MASLVSIFGEGGFVGQDHTPPPSYAETIADCKATMEAAGLIIQGPLMADGEIHRVPHSTSRKSKGSGWYVIHEGDNDFLCANYGAWNEGTSGEWFSTVRSSWTAADKATMRRQRAAIKSKRDEAYKMAASKAVEEIAQTKDASPNHQYLKGKGVKPYGIRQDGVDLIIPAQQADGSVSTYQRIRPDGSKRFLKDGKAGGSFYQIGEIGSVIYIAEGYATAATIHEATSETVVVAFYAGNIKPVSEALRGRYSLPIVIAADDDEAGRKGASAAEQAIDNASIRYPSGTHVDFNDLHVAEGIDAVQASIKLKPMLSAKTYGSDFNPGAIPSRPWIISGLYLRGYLTAFFAPGGVGKSVFAITTAIMVATGKLLINRDLEEKCNVLYINNEDDTDEIDRRIAAVCIKHDITFSELQWRIFTVSGYGNPLTIATKDDKGNVIVHPDVYRISNFCTDNSIGLVIVDPFVSTHDVPENDNTAIEKVMTQYRSLAKETNAAICLVHHTAKNGSDSEAHAGDGHAGRGASSLTGAVRIAVTLASMSMQTAKGYGLKWNLGNRLFRMDDAKANFNSKSEKTGWYELVSVDIGNGDNVGVPVTFDLGAIEKAAAEEKTAASEEYVAAKIVKIATDVIACMTAKEQPQSEVLGHYMAQVGKKKSQANEDISMLPVGIENALTVQSGSIEEYLWRTNTSSNRAPRYTISKSSGLEFQKALKNEKENRKKAELVEKESAENDVEISGASEGEE